MKESSALRAYRRLSRAWGRTRCLRFGGLAGELPALIHKATFAIKAMASTAIIIHANDGHESKSWASQRCTLHPAL